MVKEELRFEAEVSKLLDIVAHSLYSNREIFLRELISNASDACDKLRYEALTTPGLLDGDGAFGIGLGVDAEAGTLTVTDNGIGMSREELIDNLGTIARSGTQAFVERLSGDQKKDTNLIGQFGVGFYSSFMVADRVEVISRRAGQDVAWRWTSDGRGGYGLEEAARDSRGTTIILRMKDDAKEFLEDFRLRSVVKTYSDHIAVPIRMAGDDKEPVNTASALWTRSRNDIGEEQYKEFYHHVAHAFDEPWLTLHGKAEGVVEYTSLLFVPSSKPLDLFDVDRKQKIKLYVRRVFITDDCEGLLPPYLRFLRGVVDSEDLPLNISREMLQHNPVLAKIKSGLVKKVLGELARKATDATDDYATFWDNFGAVLKEGLYEDFANKDKLLELARFRSTTADGLVSLADYVGRMKDGQDAIYYITGEDVAALKRSPHLEGFRAKGVEVLLLTDPVDEFWLPAVGRFGDQPFKSATKAGSDLDNVAATEETPDAARSEEAPAPQVERLVAAFKGTLGEAVKDVRVSHRMTDSAVCLVADDDDMDMNLARMLRRHQRIDDDMPRILELNPGHPLVRRLAELADGEATSALLEDAAHLLLDQARIVEGEPVPDPAAFARRLADAVRRGLA